MSPSANNTNKNGKANASGAFDVNKVPYPSKYEIQKPWGGANNFMLSYELKPWNHEDVQEANQIAKAMQDAEYGERVAAAKRDFEKRTG